MSNLKKYRDILKLIAALIFFWLYIPHLLIYVCSKNKKAYIDSDLNKMQGQLAINLRGLMLLLFFLHNNRYYRNLFYYRIGTIPGVLIGWWRPGDKYFKISGSTKIGKGFWFAHPYSTVIYAESIGDDFRCIHLTTLGDSKGKLPVLGNNVNLAANVTIAGGVKIGDNVTIAAGSVVIHDIPSDCIAAGVPAKVVKYLRPETREASTPL